MAKRAKAKQKSSGNKAWWIVLASLMSVLAVCLFVVAGVAQYYFGGLETTKLTKDPEALGISADATHDDQIINIALFGVDSRTTAIRGRSDAVIILTVDKRHGKIKMTSVLRDSSIVIDGRGEDKIAHAYAYGQAELAIKTLNQNFNLNISEYVSVNFSSLAHIIDEVGGLDIEITERERQEINRLIQLPTSGYYGLGLDRTLVRDTGLVHLNGTQALTYARIRKIDSDNKRAERQQIVLDKLFQKAKSMSKSEYPDLIRTILPMLETSLSYSDIIGMSSILLTDGLSIEKLTIPDKSIEGINLRSGYDSNGRWVWKYDYAVATKAIDEFIYEGSNH